MSVRHRPDRAARRGGFTLVDLLFALLLSALVLFLAYRFFVGGGRTLESTKRKLDAIGRTHYGFEVLHNSLETCRFAWAPRNGSSLVVDKKELAFDPASGRLAAGGSPLRGSFARVHFEPQMDRFLLKFVVSCDRAGAPATGKPRFRERSTLVSKTFLQAQAEEVLHRQHVWEEDHSWCIGGTCVHVGFHDTAGPGS